MRYEDVHTCPAIFFYDLLHTTGTRYVFGRSRYRTAQNMQMADEQYTYMYTAVCGTSLNSRTYTKAGG